MSSKSVLVCFIGSACALTSVGLGCSETILKVVPAQSDGGAESSNAGAEPDQASKPTKPKRDAAAEPESVWTALELQTTIGEVMSIWGSSTSDVWFVANRGSGGGSALLHFVGTQVTGQNVSGSLRAIWGTAKNDAWVLGDNGSYATFDGDTWTGQSTFTTGDVYSTWGSTAAWAVGRYVGIHNLRRTKTNHTDWDYSDAYDLPSAASGKLFSVSGSGGRVFVAGEPGLWVWDGTWKSLDPGETKSVYGIPGGAVTTDGLKVHFVAGTDVIETDAQPPDVSATTSTLTAVWGTSQTDVWVVGTKGYLAHFDGSTWKRAPSLTNKDLLCIWGKESGDVWAAGDEVILHYAKP